MDLASTLNLQNKKKNQQDEGEALGDENDQTMGGEDQTQPKKVKKRKVMRRFCCYLFFMGTLHLLNVVESWNSKNVITETERK